MSFISDAIAAKKTLYFQVCDAITRITTGAQESSLNDSQVDSKVKEADLSQLVEMKADLENEIAEYEGCGGGAVYVR